TAAHQSTPPTARQAEQWRTEVAGVLAVVQQLGGDLRQDYGVTDRDVQPVGQLRDQVVDLEQDVTAILAVYGEGFDSPHSPVNDQAVLQSTAARLDNAGRKAEVILGEVQQLRASYSSNGR